MANEPYIKRLEREKYELVEALRTVLAWRHALYLLNTARYKGDARQAFDAKELELNEMLKTIEPLLAEAEEKDERRKK